jgi:excisionase family DNA binding protein
MGFTVREFADQLQVSTATVYGWVKAGKLAHMRLAGNVIRIPTTAVQRLSWGFEPPLTSASARPFGRYGSLDELALAKSRLQASWSPNRRPEANR